LFAARSKLHVEPTAPDFVQYKVDDLFHRLVSQSVSAFEYITYWAASSALHATHNRCGRLLHMLHVAYTGWPS